MKGLPTRLVLYCWSCARSYVSLRQEKAALPRLVGRGPWKVGTKTHTGGRACLKGGDSHQRWKCDDEFLRIHASGDPKGCFIPAVVLLSQGQAVHAARRRLVCSHGDSYVLQQVGSLTRR